jgi:hypothetical protein
VPVVAVPTKGVPSIWREDALAAPFVLLEMIPLKLSVAVKVCAVPRIATVSVTFGMVTVTAPLLAGKVRVVRLVVVPNTI